MIVINIVFKVSIAGFVASMKIIVADFSLRGNDHFKKHYFTYETSSLFVSPKIGISFSFDTIKEKKLACCKELTVLSQFFSLIFQDS